MKSLTILLLLSTSACLPSYSFDETPLAHAPRSAAERCYQERRMELTHGSAEWRSQYQSGDYLVTETSTAGGLSLVHGGHRMAAPDALALLGDAALAEAYHRKLAETASARRWYPRWRNLSIGMALTGLAITVGALALAEHDARDRRVLPLAGAGAGVALLSILPALGAWKTHDGAVDHDRYQALFSEAAWTPELLIATRAYNQHAADQCGAPASSDLSQGDHAVAP